jgi:hypothetical protein
VASQRRETSPLEESDNATKVVRRPPATTLEGRENQLVALAYDVVEKRLRSGDATSQETTHFLKLGSTMAQLEKEQLQARVELLQKQVEQLESNKRLEEKYDAAIAAMRSYAGQEPRHDNEEYYD